MPAVTLQELSRTLPNGFHDAKLARVELDYARQEALLHLSLLVGDPDAPEYEAREAQRPAVLTLTGLQYLVVPPPEYTYDPETVNVDLSEDPAPPPVIGPPVPGAFHARFFVSEWNALIQVSATGASLAWADET